MKVVEVDEKRKMIKVVPENVEDLYLLSQTILPGDRVLARTTRKIKREDGESKRIPMDLEIEVESIGFHEFGGLRIHGRIVRGPKNLVPIGSYHTITINKYQELTIFKSRGFESALKKFEEASLPPKKVLIISLDHDEASIVLLDGRNMETVAEIRSNIPGKHYQTGEKYDSLIKAYFSEILREAKKYENVDGIIIAGPGQIKEDFLERSGLPAALVDTSMGGIAGVYEAIRRGAPKDIAERQRILEESSLVEEILASIFKGDKKYVYGLKRVREAAEMGAVEELYVSDKFFHELLGRGELRDVLENVERFGGSRKVISTSHPRGKRFDIVLRIAAKLRYQIDRVLFGDKKKTIISRFLRRNRSGPVAQPG